MYAKNPATRRVATRKAIAIMLSGNKTASSSKLENARHRRDEVTVCASSSNFGENMQKVSRSTADGTALSAATHNKVLVIMEDGILQKQPYRGTGSQRDSTSRVNAFRTSRFAENPCKGSTLVGLQKTLEKWAS